MHAHLDTQPCFKSGKKKQLQIIQNKIVHFIMGARSRAHIGRNELDNVSLLSSRDRVVQLKVNQVFKNFHNLFPDYMKMYFTRVSSVHRYSTRGNPFNFVIPCSKGQARFTFYNTAIHHWNCLPNEIKDIYYFF